LATVAYCNGTQEAIPDARLLVIKIFGIIKVD